MADPNVPRRDQLEKLLPSIDLIRQFERLFEQAGNLLPSDVEALYKASEEALIDANTAIQIANMALGYVSALNDKVQKVAKVTTSYTVPVGNYSVIVDSSSGEVTITLPKADTATGFIVGITKEDTTFNSVIIEPDGVETIAGDTKQELYYENEVLNFISDGTNWQVVN